MNISLREKDFNVFSMSHWPIWILLHGHLPNVRATRVSNDDVRLIIENVTLAVYTLDEVSDEVNDEVNETV